MVEVQVVREVNDGLVAIITILDKSLDGHIPSNGYGKTV
jgi:hypothetical protein